MMVRQAINRDWENTYRNKGVVQRDVLPTVRQSIGLLKYHRCEKILDLCCGTGRHSLYLAQHDFTVYGIDASSTAIDITAKRARQADLSNIILMVSDMRSLCVPDSFFDALLCVWSIGHGFKEDMLRLIAELHRVLKPGGLLLADFPSDSDDNCGRGIQLADNTYLHPFLDHSDVPHFYFSKPALLEMLKNNFEILQLQTVFYEDLKHNSILSAFWVEALNR